MMQNLLKLNSNKMEFILFGTRQQLSKVDDISHQISSDTVKSVDHVRNLGYVMDSLLKNGPHVNKFTSFCYCTVQYQIDKLQHIQNMSCQVICNISKYDHVSPAIRDLHWLKIPERIIYKLCLLVYKCCNNLAPKYLSDLLPSRTSSRLLRSSHSVNIIGAYFKNSQYQCLSFSSVGPRAWNSLPTRVKTAQSLDSFKSLLKTHLFTISYNK